MGKRKGKNSLEERARRTLARAQEALQRAQLKRSRAVLKGERDIERARIRSAERVARATRRVERKSAAAARAEAHLRAVCDMTRHGAPETASRPGGVLTQREVQPAHLEIPEGIAHRDGTRPDVLRRGEEARDQPR